ncbi:M48 family metallopeptidase [Noviherbaspirillum saxi]|uniref:PDZ domain-containing protein n=1 Tax=Noviherbaspirillum saxi TaxID=2320863 RepID=A0A3A3FLA9_9BURK|nr:M48 family metallopeptidase [Noviherbaspirillum saxi]RJF95944.1 PDZ domain-containing protein [Noviherbaspirillum saxi]
MNRSLKRQARLPLVLLLVLISAGCATRVRLDTPATPASRMPVPQVPVAPPVAEPSSATEVYSVDLGSTQVKDMVELVPPQELEFLRSWVSAYSRLYEVAGNLMIRNVQSCPNNARRILGFTAKNRYSYTQRYSDAASAALGLGERLQVFEVISQGGAHSAGIRKGDILLEINGQPLPAGAEAEREAAILVGAETRGKEQVDVTLSRQDQEMSLTVPLTEACAFGIELGNSNAIASYSDGYRVMVTRGMLDFVQSDEELAFVIAGEFARNLSTKQDTRAMAAIIDRLRSIGSVTDMDAAVMALKPYSAEEDIKADQLALQMLARSRYKVLAYRDFLKRLSEQDAANQPGGYNWLHPQLARRLAAIEKSAISTGRR